MTGPRIALIHAVSLAIAPVVAAFGSHWPQARPVSLLDESLQPDRDAASYGGPSFHERLGRLADYALDIGSEGILFTCSAFADEIEAVKARLAIPVYRPDEAVLEAALRTGGNVVVLVTFGPSIGVLSTQLKELAPKLGHTGAAEVRLVPDALDAVRAGDRDRHDTLIAAAAAAAGDATIVLGQYSMTGAAEAVLEATGRRPLTGPDQAVLKLKHAVTG
ncbi:MAG: aspartate/glutamate racemase family protein [Hyphomicrobiaceae bacterium]